MIQTIKCPKCGEEVEISKAIFEEQLMVAKKEVEEESNRRVKELSREMADLIKANQNLKRLEEERELETAKKIATAEDKVREEASKKATEEAGLKLSEKDKKISDMEKMIEELKRTAQQGSQQTQGEVLELELEQTLKNEFPNDIVTEVAKGIHGADIIQEVLDKQSRSCGIMIWESKNAKWNANWIAKLKDDQRGAKADIAVLLTIDLPKEYQPFKFAQGVWVTDKNSFLALAMALRIQLYQVYVTKQADIGKDEKKEFLYQYVMGKGFQQRVEAIKDTYLKYRESIEVEKRWFTKKWADQEQSIRKLIDQMQGIEGDLLGITGGSLGEIKSLESPKE